jgi:hypothetical protein
MMISVLPRGKKIDFFAEPTWAKGKKIKNPSGRFGKKIPPDSFSDFFPPFPRSRDRVVAMAIIITKATPATDAARIVLEANSVAADPFDVLQVSADFTVKHVKSQHKMLVKILHPDHRHGPSNDDACCDDAFKCVQQAYEQLVQSELSFKMALGIHDANALARKSREQAPATAWSSRPADVVFDAESRRKFFASTDARTRTNASWGVPYRPTEEELETEARENAKKRAQFFFQRPTSPPFVRKTPNPPSHKRHRTASTKFSATPPPSQKRFKTSANTQTMFVW